MDFSSENQSSEAGAAQAAKLGGSRKGPDAQSVTKRYVNAPKFFLIIFMMIDGRILANI